MKSAKEIRTDLSKAMEHLMGDDDLTGIGMTESDALLYDLVTLQMWAIGRLLAKFEELEEKS